MECEDTPRTRKSVIYPCKKYKGKKEVDPRTKNNYLEKYRIYQPTTSTSDLASSMSQTLLGLLEQLPDNNTIEDVKIDLFDIPPKSSFLVKKKNDKAKSHLTSKIRKVKEIFSKDIEEIELFGISDNEEGKDQNIFESNNIYLLISIDNQFEFFLPSINLARKSLGICLHIKKYAARTLCHKLYNPEDVTTKTPEQISTYIECEHIEYPSHSMSKMRKNCGNLLAKKIPIKERLIYRAKMGFPTIRIKDQLKLMYNHKGFEKSL
ncbi:20173_t:CDS:2 [Dentiscutata erythropus]|uniref:20173_t:CDS:1 n=1 Tax=Dentiscutata erythropus TaxID=1348616 RepID=A0A9N9IKS0_9GLOM|nr:20173_t:CDS:2 [Dentiscutata erythropus]